MCTCLKIKYIHIVVFTLIILLCSCHGSKHRQADLAATDRPMEVMVSGLSGSADSKALIKEAKKWLGVPYRYGGNDKEGVDCSGMVVQVFLNARGVKLPRTCMGQSEYVKEVNPDDMSTGDLVFFATGKDTKKISHVGIMIDNDNFIHASSTKGVIVSQLSSAYYQRTLRKIGRVID